MSRVETGDCFAEDVHMDKGERRGRRRKATRLQQSLERSDLQAVRLEKAKVE